MHELMLGMFLGGALLAAPPVLLGIAITIYLMRQRRREQGSTLDSSDPAPRP
jgi:hypothetical protein